MKAGLLGRSIAGSLSPWLFYAAYKGKYPYDLLDFPTFQEGWEAFLKAYDGVNVTAPYKEEAAAMCRSLSPGALACGAVNLVLRDGLRGFNTDIDGVKGALGEASSLPGEALVTGTGGAARAAIVACMDMGIEVHLWGRSSRKVEELCREFGCKGAGEKDNRPELLIHTLPSGAVPPSFLDLSNAIVLEAEYARPMLSQTPCRQYIGGKRWLLNQAVSGFEIFTGRAPSKDAMELALKENIL